MSEIISSISSNFTPENTGGRSESNTIRLSNRSDIKNNTLNESLASIVTSFTVYKLMNEVIKPFTALKAYQNGLIDANGNLLKSEAEMTAKEKNILSPFTRLVIGIKRLVQAIPGNKLKADFNYIQTAAKAMAFECHELGGDGELFLEELQKSLDVLMEEGEVAAGDSTIGNVIGAGFSNPQVGEPNKALAGYSPPLGMVRRKPRGVSPIPGTAEPAGDPPPRKKIL